MSYRNPVIPGFHPDPSVCRVRDEYFLVTSSFTYFPGVPIFRSTNLVDWQQIGNVLDRPSQLDLSASADYASGGVFAPTIRHHDGRFWMITTNFGRGMDNFFVTAEDPAGPWSDPTHLDIGGIDPDLAWDDAGTCWVHFSVGTGIQRCRIDDQTGEILEPPTATWSGTGLQFPEAPHLIRRGDAWYLLIAEGGTERGHAVSIARAPTPIGPWEGSPANPIVSHRSTDRPIQSTGHADMVEATDGSWWMVLLGTRPRGFTPGFHVLGRETFLTPVDWVDGWPAVADIALDMPTSPPGAALDVADTTRDDFDEPMLGLQWLTVRGPRAEAEMSLERAGHLVLHGDGRGLDDPEPVFVGRRQQHQLFRARCLVDAGDSTEAGLAVRIDERHHYEVFVGDAAIGVRAGIGPLAEVVARVDRSAGEGDLVLRIETVDGFFGPDLIRLGYEDETGSFTAMAELDGRYLSTEVATGFLGRVIGLYVVDGTAAFDWFELGPTESPATPPLDGDP